MTVSVVACTVITQNRVAHARVLSATLREHNPGARVVALLLDDSDGAVAGEPFEIVRPEQLELEHAEFRRMAAMYNGLELSCAMKPWVIGHVLAHEEAVLYLDSDVEVFDTLEMLRALVLEHSLVLTPHLTEPPPWTPEAGEEETRLVGGAYNNGFLGVSRAAALFLEWWRERLSRHCLDALDHGLFVDQRWVDLAPAYFQAHVLRDPGSNVAPWNLVTRRVSEAGGSYRVDGVPLRFFHFSGFDSERPYLLSKWLLPTPHTLLSEHPALARICREYARKLTEAGYLEASRAPYGFAGLDRQARRAYRDALLAAERAGGPEPPNPLEG
jgi:hypothetical protein